MLMLKSLLPSCVAIILLGLTSECGWSQTARTIKIVVPFPPGGVNDILARMLAEQVGRTQGPTIVVENRPGAGTTIGTEAVSRATPDGNTVLMMGNSFVISPNLKQLNYNPLTSFEPICYLARSTFIIAVNSASPYRTLPELVSAAHDKPGELSMASAGPATTSHIAFEMLKRAAKFN